MREEKKLENEVISLIEVELNNIELLRKELSKYRKINTNLYRRAKGSILHDFYNACERIFKIIVRVIDGDKTGATKWHKTILNQMTIEIKGTRPAVISRKLAAELYDYLNFRHLFRNIYGFELEGEKLDKLADKFEKICRAFNREIKSFITKL